MMIASYVLMRRPSRSTNLYASSQIQRTALEGISESDAFVFAHAITLFTLSTCVTKAPALALARVAPPVYAKRFKMRRGLLSTLSIIQSQLIACSGNIPTCLKLVDCSSNVRFLYPIRHGLGVGFCITHRPASESDWTNVALAISQRSLGRDGDQRILGSGRMIEYIPKRSSFLPFPLSIHS